jgi:acyl-coenzyme A synthetase/AMP-(fatty) acid ligase
LFANLRNPLKTCRAIHEQRLRTFCGVPSTFYALTEFHRLHRLEVRSVKIVCSAGAAMDRERFQEVKEIFPEALFFNNYGMTEAAPRIAFIREDDPRFGEPTCGRPMEGVQVKIVDPQTHEPLADGQLGMLAVKGPNVTSGYLHDPELTDQAFTRDGYLLSGDSAFLDQGYIFVNGRYDDIFNVAGEKVCPLEIERVLNESSAVDMSAVVGVPDAQRGMVPVAFLKLNRHVTRRELQELLRGRLLDIKMPQRYLEVSAFPTTANGKLRRKNLSPDNPSLVLREIT